HVGRPVALGARPRRADPLALDPAARDVLHARADGSRSLGSRLRGVVFHLNYESDDTRAIDDTQVVADMKDALGLPDLDVQVHVVSRWSMEGILADRFQVGRVFLVGDAAH